MAIRGGRAPIKGMMNDVSPGPETLTVGAAARRLGVAAPTLRSWERRYGLAPSGRSTGGHRRYSAGDLARLRAMLRLLDQGVPTAEAAAQVRDRDFPVGATSVTSDTSVAAGHRTGPESLPRQPSSGSGSLPPTTSGARSPRRAAQPAHDPGADRRTGDAAGDPASFPGGRRSGRGGDQRQTGTQPAGRTSTARGGRPTSAEWWSGDEGQAFQSVRKRAARPEADLFALANALDGERLTHEVARALDRYGAVDAWTRRLAPLLVAVGDQWERTGACVEVEHLASDAVAGGLRYHTRRSVDRFRPKESERPVVLACLERERHALPLLAVAAAMAERAVRVRTLGAATPVASLSSAVRLVRPAAVFVWSSAPETADLEALKVLARTRPSYSLVVGGPGWAVLGRPNGWVNSLPDAVAALVRAVRP